MAISGEEWKYACDGEPLSPYRAKQLATSKARILVHCTGQESVHETRILETSPDGDYVKLGTSFGFMAGSVWLPSEAVRVLCVLQDAQ
jgi:hypothetical protein